ncbi:hypothetical protein KKH05_03170, partial [Patescibacteria group bacterium]|nr:hypothetical protein [Patescibacteria group bacterium]
SEQLFKPYANAPSSDGPRNDTWGFDCKIWNENGSPAYEGNANCAISEAPNNSYDDWSASNLGSRAREGLDDVEEMVLLIVEVLFNAAFTFIGAFTLLGIGLLLIYRYVALSLLMILFPFAWLGWVFPKIAVAGGSKDIWNAWWGQFLRWLLFGPVAMFFIYLSARAAMNLDALTTSSGEALVGMGSMAVIAASVGNAAVVIGLLIGGAQIADKFGIAGAGMIMGAVKEVSKVAGKTSATLVGKGATRAAGGAVMGIGAAMGGRGAPQNAEGMRTGLRGRLYDVGRNLEERGRSTVVKDKDGRAVTRRVVTDANGNIDHAWRVQTDAEGKREYQRNQGTQANPDWVASTERDAHQNGRATTTDPYRRAELRTSDTVLARGGRIGRAFRRGGGPSASLQVKAEAQSMWRSPFNIFGEVLRTGKRAAKKGK